MTAIVGVPLTVFSLSWRDMSAVTSEQLLLRIPLNVIYVVYVVVQNVMNKILQPVLNKEMINVTSEKLIV